MRIKVLLLFALVILCRSVSAQTTEFTYQGRLLFSGVPASGSYDFQFSLFDDVAAGTQQGSTLTLTAVNVNNGVFSVRLDFGDQFPGAARFLEISVRSSGDPTFTLLSPRQAITSAPYAIKSLNADSAANATAATNALQLNGIASSQFVLTNDPRMSDARNPLPNSPNYIRNSVFPQAASNFNISGSGNVGLQLTANLVNARSEFWLGGSRIVSTAGTNNLFVGVGSGFSNTTGGSNAFFGTGAGQGNTTGGGNSFFGQAAGQVNTSGLNNSFFGNNSGVSNTTASNNAFFGASTGKANTTGSSNSFFGSEAGLVNTTGANDAFFGQGAGAANTTGESNAFFGAGAGLLNTTGNQNSFFGQSAGLQNTTGTLNSFFGQGAGLSNSTGGANSFFGAGAGALNRDGSLNSFFGYTAGQSNTSGISNSFFGEAAGSRNTLGTANSFFGTSAGVFNSSGNKNSIFGTGAGFSNTTGSFNTFFGFGSAPDNQTGIANVFVGSNAGIGNVAGNGNTIIGANGSVGSPALDHATAIGADAIVTASNTIQLGRFVDRVRISGLGTGGTTSLCRNIDNEISTCGSSSRYKSNINPFNRGLDLLNRLRPVSFQWNAGGALDLGLVAEEVNQVEPLLTTTNDKGEIEGVKYDRITVVLLNAVRQQQEQIKNQQQQIEALKRLVCAGKARANVCREGQR